VQQLAAAVQLTIRLLLLLLISWGTRGSLHLAETARADTSQHQG
jgi:hypothetical protein